MAGETWGPFHRHFANDAIHRDGGPECDQPGTPRRVYVFDPDYLEEHDRAVRVAAVEPLIRADERAKIIQQWGGVSEYVTQMLRVIDTLAYRVELSEAREANIRADEREQRELVDWTHKSIEVDLRAQIAADIEDEERAPQYPGTVGSNAIWRSDAARIARGG